MFRNFTGSFLPWSVQTQTMIEKLKGEKAEQILYRFPQASLFEPTCTDKDAESLYSASFFADEKRFGNISPDASVLKKEILGRFAHELTLLSRLEYDLVLKLLFHSGTVVLETIQDFIGGLGLCKRLLCSIEHKESLFFLKLPPILASMSALILADENHRRIRTFLGSVEQKVRDTLNIAGLVKINGPLLHMKSVLQQKENKHDEYEFKRFLLNTFDYQYDYENQILLIHDGLITADYITGLSCYMGDAMIQVDNTSIEELISSNHFIEHELFLKSSSFLQGFLQPQFSAQNAVSDLILLIKQNIPWEDLLQVLSSMISGIVTPDMISIVKELYFSTPRWLTLNTGRKH